MDRPRSQRWIAGAPVFSIVIRIRVDEHRSPGGRPSAALGALINGLRAMNKPLVHKSRRMTSIIAIAATALSAIVATFGVVMPYVSHGTAAPMEFSYYTWIPSGLGHVGQPHRRLQSRLRAPRRSALLHDADDRDVDRFPDPRLRDRLHGPRGRGYTRFFTYLNLFMFMMLLLVLGANYIVMFVGWEGVGLCSYLLIGFYYDKNFAADAGKKAFIVNRIGDFGFILGIFLIFNTSAPPITRRSSRWRRRTAEQYAGVATAICLLLFVGACGKSAQVPAVRLAARRDGRPDAGLAR